jgi:hypothetical protein
VLHIVTQEWGEVRAFVEEEAQEAFGLREGEGVAEGGVGFGWVAGGIFGEGKEEGGFEGDGDSAGGGGLGEEG